MLYILIYLLSLAAPKEGTYQLIQEESQLQWKGYLAHNGYSLGGSFDLKNGVLEYRDGTFVNGDFEADLSQLRAEDADLEEHLKGEDFFHTAQYPKASFQLEALVPTKDKNQYTALGTFTILGKTLQVEFPVFLKQQRKKLHLKALVHLNRTQFGMYYKSPSVEIDLGPEAIADIFDLNLDLWFQWQG